MKDDFARHSSVDMAATFPKQLSEGYALAGQINYPSWRNINSLLLCGMGGSGIGGELFRAIFSEQLRIPCGVNKDYSIPKWVNENTLVIISSYSGNTEETLAMYSSAKAQSAKLVTIASGGALASKAQADGFPVVQVPSGFAPRAATGYLFASLLAIAEHFSLVSDCSEDVKETVVLLEELNKEVLEFSEGSWFNALAGQLQAKLPVIYGLGNIGEVIAYRWRCQFNEYSKTLALSHSLPEMCHNEIVGWERIQAINSNAIIILIEDSSAFSRNLKRLDILKQLLVDKLPFVSIATRGQSRMARTLSGCYIGDMLSIYLALTDNIDPAAIHNIDYLKQKLSV